MQSNVLKHVLRCLFVTKSLKSFLKSQEQRVFWPKILLTKCLLKRKINCKIPDDLVKYPQSILVG